jgi:hypothetical protein
MRPSAKVFLWRDSVAAGDDVDAPHEMALDLPPGSTVGALCSRLVTLDYLPSVSGGRATWILEGTRALAVFAQQWASPKFLLAEDMPIAALLKPKGAPHLEFLYWCQVDPELVHRNLLSGLPLPGKYSA